LAAEAALCISISAAQTETPTENFQIDPIDPMISPLFNVIFKNQMT
jgi:hypothetical protein